MSIGIADKPVPLVERSTDPGRWLSFLPRWALLVALISMALPVIFLWGLGQPPSDAALGGEYVELLQAVRSPGMFRLAWAIDALIWLLLGVSLLVYAGLLRRSAPLPAAIIALCSFAQLFGVMGSFLRLDTISDLAGRYAAGTAVQQENLLQTYLTLGRIIRASNHVGVLLQGLGFLLAAGSVFRLRGFPRWLAIWLLLPGLLSMAQFVFFLSGAPYLFALNVIGLIGGNIALNLAVSAALWRPSPELAVAVTRPLDR